MFYLFEFDTRSIVAKSENGEDLAEFILDNELTLAFCVIESADDLDMELSDDEMNELYNNLGHPVVKGSLIEDLWEAIQDSSPDFKKFGKGVASKLLKTPQDKPEKAEKPKKSGPRKPRQANVKYLDKVFTPGPTPPMKGRHSRIVGFIEDNLGEATGQELHDFLEGEGTNPKEHISYAIRNGYISEVDNEL